MFLYQNLSKFFLRNSRSFLEFIFILQTIFMHLNSYINFIGMEFIDLKLLLTYSWKSYRLNNLNNPDLFHLSIFASHRLNSLNWLHFYWTWSFLSSFDFLIFDHYFLLLTHLDCFLLLLLFLFSYHLHFEGSSDEQSYQHCSAFGIQVLLAS